MAIRKIERKEPVPLVAHLVTIDLAKSGPLAIAVDRGEDGAFRASTVRDLAAKSGLELAVNASFFEVPKGRYPAAGERADAVGGLVLEGKTTGAKGTIGGLLDGALCFDAHAARVEKGFACKGARWGLATGPVLLWKGARTDTAFADAIFKSLRHPRTAAAWTPTRRTVWLLVVDGRQPGVSEGATLDELKETPEGRGRDGRRQPRRRRQLDAGRSASPTAAYKVLNVPVHERTPGRERPVVNAVGVGGRLSSRQTQPAATRASLKKSAGIGLASFQVIAMGRSPR